MNNNNGENNDNNIENFLEYDVSNDEWLQILNNPKQLSTIICWNSLYQYMLELNKEYCAKHCLCEICRSELIEHIDYEEIWGSKRISNVEYTCPNGC
jgi:hypothetical protein